jgi:hypothetical protein
MFSYWSENIYFYCFFTVLFSHRDLILVAVLPEGGGGEPLLDEGLCSVHDSTACPHILYFSP